MKLRFVWLLFLISIPASAQQARIYRHPAGLEFQYPQDWTVRESQLGEAQLVPPNQQQNEQGITEAFFLWGIGGPFEGPTDIRLAEYLNKLLTRVIPFLKQNSAPQAASVEFPAITLSWSGQSDDGIIVSSMAFAATNGPYALALVMLGSQDRMTARDAAIREIFSSFRFTSGQRDASLAAIWKSPAAQTQSSDIEGLEMALQVDGSFQFRESSNPELKGQWFAADGRLCFVYPESLFLNFHYEIEGEPGARKLTLRHSSGGFQTLIETK